MHEFLQAYAKSIGQSESEVGLYGPDASAARYGPRGWHVIWEGGPFEWAVSLSGGESLTAEETVHITGRRGTAEVDLHPVGVSWGCEPFHKCSLGFYDEEGSDV